MTSDSVHPSELFLAGYFMHTAHDELKVDWEAARKLSLTGFGDKRAELWPSLLNARAPCEADDSDTTSHSDERQIQLDTDRSFVLYPVEPPGGKDKPTLQKELNELIVSIFRRRPKLSYFQGYHDIVSVLYLTLPPNVHLSCAEKLSLHRLRDSMGKSLDPILGLLRVLRNLIRLTDPDYAIILEDTSPLPYPLLSSVLTLLSHDMPALPLIQHLFDYLLCREPIMVVYVCAAIVITRKPQIEQILEEEGEDGNGMIHSILGHLNDIHHHEPLDSLFQPEVAGQDLETRLHQGQEILSPEEIPLPLSDDETPEEMGDSSVDDLHPSFASPKVPLTSILSLSESLYSSYPPSHPDLHLASIMGPQSVVFTWSDNPSDLPSDDEAEKMLDHPELVVRPFDPSDDSSMVKKKIAKNPSRKGGQRAMLASATIVLGIAVAVYALQSSSSSSSQRFNWALIGGWVGGNIS